MLKLHHQIYSQHSLKLASYTPPGTPTFPRSLSSTPPSPTAGTQEEMQSLEGLREQSEMYQPEVLTYYCKLCSVKSVSLEQHTKHTKSERHQLLNARVMEQFNFQIGNDCKACYIQEAEEMYNFCENDEHFEVFSTIWSNRETTGTSS